MKGLKSWQSKLTQIIRHRSGNVTYCWNFEVGPGLFVSVVHYPADYTWEFRQGDAVGFGEALREAIADRDDWLRENAAGLSFTYTWAGIIQKIRQIRDHRLPP